MTTADAARALGITAGTVRDAIASGRLPAVRRGRDWDVSADAVDRYRRESRGRPGRRPPGRADRVAVRRWSLERDAGGRARVWIIAPAGGRAAGQSAVRWADGTIAYDRPDELPAYVRAAVGRYWDALTDGPRYVPGDPSSPAVRICTGCGRPLDIRHDETD